MKITEHNILVYDIETIKGYFLYCCYDPFLEIWHDFHINEYQNDLPALLRFIDENREDHYFIGYNNINFDNQVMEYVWKEQNKLLNMSSLDCSTDIWQFAQDLIETMNHGGYAPYREEYFTFKQIDCFKILHGDNKARIGSSSLVFSVD